MFSYCSDPSALEGLTWLSCYLTTGKHFAFYSSFLTVLFLLAVTAPVALFFGFLGATASRSHIAPLRWFGKSYTSVVRGVPDIAFFMFFVIALDQAVEWTRHKVKCPEWTDAIRQGSDFLVCPDAKMPLSSSAQWVHETYSFSIAVFTFAIVFGAFAANVLYGAMQAVPRAQMETAEAYGMSHRQSFWRILVPQMWIFALPGLSNLWLILVKATPLLFLLGIHDIVFWAREMGGHKTNAFDYPHPDWRIWYFLGLMVFYLTLTKVSEIAFAKLTRKLSRGQATAGGEAQRREATA
ncbi:MULTISPECIES: ABC transporter permease [Falsihalocynthiibacter]|uniref:ABC transporter permease n=1 Tax=Falsihalocynthiibacter TaxID=2854182 RepID=UPI0030026878